MYSRFLSTLVVVSCVVGSFFCSQHSSAQEAKIKALIVDGQNNHNWKATTPVLKDILEKSGRFTVDVVTSPTQDDKKADNEAYQKKMAEFKPIFKNYDVVIGNYNGDEWASETKKSFEQYVANGGGYVSYHAADNAFSQWKEYNEMCGIGGWGGRNEKSGPYLYWENGKAVRNTEPGSGGHHGPQWEFLIEVRDFENPVTKGLPKSFRHCKDELYDLLRGPAKDVSILATALADKEHQGSGRHEPMLMTIPYGKGRVFHTTLGHDVPQIKSVSFIATFLRGAEWAATGKVTIPVPDDMPGDDKPTFRE